MLSSDKEIMTVTNERSAKEFTHQNIVDMGEPLGILYSTLWQHLTLLYTKWGDYIALFGTNPERIKLLNKAAPTFFRTVQDCLWDDSLMHLARITDSSSTGKKQNLTIRRLPELVSDDTHRIELEVLIDLADKATAFARDWRNRKIAHKDLQLALDLPTESLATASRQHVTDALSSIAHVLNYLSSIYSGSTTIFEFAAEPKAGGASTLLFYLRSGLEVEDERRLRLTSGSLSPKDIDRRSI